tara:strand:+ start:18593 stop:19663 length:1071 start_codon:yes stop_codon:yes gene_type:complete
MILERYIARHLTTGWLIVLAVLAAVFGLIIFIQELDKAKQAYDTLAAARYTAAVLPGELVSLAPVIALLGSIVGLASLDRFNELTVISAAGFRLRRLLAAIFLPTLMFMLVLWVCMEYLTPPLQQSTERERNHLRHGSTTWIPSGGVWSTDGRRYIHLDHLSEDNVPGNISLFEFARNGELVRHLRAKTAEVGADRRWSFRNVREKVLVDGVLQSRKHDELSVANLWAPDELPNLSLPSAMMRLSVLYTYANYLRSIDQPFEQQLNTFWQKLMMPFTVLAMVLLATPLSSSVTVGRDHSFGFKIGLGALLGIVFYLSAQVIFALGQLFQVPEALLASLPALIIASVALALFGRMRW